jgi:hypothetical protein
MEDNYSLAIRHFEGTRVPVDTDLAFKYFTKSANIEDNSAAQFNLGVFYLKGLSVEENKEKASAWFRLAIDNGYPPLEIEFQHDGEISLHAEGWLQYSISRAEKVQDMNLKIQNPGIDTIEKTNLIRSFQNEYYDQYNGNVFNWLKHPSLKQSPLASVLMDEVMLDQLLVEFSDPTEISNFVEHGLDFISTYFTHIKAAVDHLENIDVSNNMEDSICNHFIIGICYFKGISVNQDYEKAYNYFVQQTNNADCLFYLGLMHQEGFFVKKNPNIAFTLYDEAIENSTEYDWASNHLFYNLGKIYQYGKGDIAQDHKTALAWFLKTHFKWNTKWSGEAYYELGMYYYEGKYIQEDCEYAYNYLEYAAKNKHSKAKQKMSQMLMEGDGVKKDIKKALDLINGDA